MAVLITERLTLREIAADDAEFILRLLNEPSFLEYIGDRGVRTAEQARAYIDTVVRQSYREFGFGLYLVVQKEGYEPIGICGVLRRAWLDHPDIAYAFVPEATGRGLALESATAVLRHARTVLHLERIAAIVVQHNAPSIRLLHKLGFSQLGVVTDPRNGTELQLFLDEADRGDPGIPAQREDGHRADRRNP